MDFFNILMSPELLEMTESLMPKHRARQRLPLGMVSALARKTGSLLNEKSQVQCLWRGRPVQSR